MVVFMIEDNHRGHRETQSTQRGTAQLLCVLCDPVVVSILHLRPHRAARMTETISWPYRVP
jgi:hypothetical protein